MNSLVDELISLGIDKIRLGVLKGNLKALEFWRKLDFSIINDSSIVTINGHISTVFILEKQLKKDLST